MGNVDPPWLSTKLTRIQLLSLLFQFICKHFFMFCFFDVVLLLKKFHVSRVLSYFSSIWGSLSSQNISLCSMFSAEIWMSILIMSEVEYWKIWICLNFGWWVNIVSVTFGHCGFIWCAHFPVKNIWTQQIFFLVAIKSRSCFQN